jgi:RecA-family ATPase
MDACDLTKEQFERVAARAFEDDDPRPEPPPVGAEGEAKEDVFDGWKTLAERPESWLTTEPPERRYLLRLPDGRGLLPLGKVGLLAAAGGVGKTFALTQLALAVASGRPWLETYDVDAEAQEKVLLVAAEEDDEELRRRLFVSAEAAALSPDERARAGERLVAIGAAGFDVSLTDIGGNLTPFAHRLKTQLEKDIWSLIVLDPLSRFGGVETESDNAMATRLVQALEQLAKAPGTPAVLMAHHTNKQSRNGKSRAATASEDATATRGSSALSDGVRWLARMEEKSSVEGYHGPQLVTFRVAKNNYGPTRSRLDLARYEDDQGALVKAPRTELKQYLAAQSKGNEASEASGQNKAEGLL